MTDRRVTARPADVSMAPGMPAACWVPGRRVVGGPVKPIKQADRAKGDDIARCERLPAMDAEYPEHLLAREPAPPYAGEGPFALWHFSEARRRPGRRSPAPRRRSRSGPRGTRSGGHGSSCGSCIWPTRSLMTWPGCWPPSTARRSPTRAATSSGGLRWWSSPPASRTCLRASSPEGPARHSDAFLGRTPDDQPVAAQPVWWLPLRVAGQPADHRDWRAQLVAEVEPGASVRSRGRARRCAWR